MVNSFPVIIAISQKRVHIHSSKQGNDQPGISSGSINLRPPALNDSPKAVLLLGEIRWGSLLWNKVRLPEQNDTLFEMLKLIVNYLSRLRLKTLQTIPRSVAHNCFGQIQSRSQLSEQCRECTCGYRFIYYISSLNTCVAKSPCCCSHKWLHAFD